MKNHFPIFRSHPNLTYMDSAATTPVPDSVLAAVNSFVSKSYGSVRRGVYRLSEEATALCESSREKVRAFIGATKPEQIIFTGGTTHSINLLAFNFLLDRLGPGDKILLTETEHHSNLVPWQTLARLRQAELVYLRVDGNLEIDPDSVNWDDPAIKLCSYSLVSNISGRVAPWATIATRAKARGIPIHIDAAQAVTSMPIDVNQLECDFLSFSAHKIYGFPGTGCLYVAANRASEITVGLGGGGMVADVNETTTKALPLPFGLEAGSPNSVGIVSMGAALDFIAKNSVLDCAPKLLEIAGRIAAKLGETSTVIGQANAAPIVSFTHPKLHAHDAASFLAEHDIALRAGHHCAKLLMKRIAQNSVLRVSLSCFNDEADAEKFFVAWQELLVFFRLV